MKKNKIIGTFDALESIENEKQKTPNKSWSYILSKLDREIASWDLKNK